ncbi:uncharacterized protein LOC105178826 [Sesamum indicum]|uniref:Uncharacterized protein LOC105178826 n=1 Tax=Sesamum indicum TaxID=4182 RepID=A0A6I9UMX5_SESIN|nr:uncharacterized protein LOC105178826 [Sesamum indicum]
MWAALPLQPPKPWPLNALSTTKPPPLHSVPIANRQNGGEMGGPRQVVVTALNSNKPQHRNATKSRIESEPPPPLEKQEKLEEQQQQQQRQRQLSGADVLMALERATADKTKKKKARRNTGGLSRGRNSAGTAKQETSNFSDVRPLCIKPEWSDRLEELERRLQQLAHSQGHR